MFTYFPKEYHLDALHYYATEVHAPNVQLTIGDREELIARIAIDAIKLGATATEIKEALGFRKPLTKAEKIALRKAGGDPNPFN